jgi:hypothetical protein
MNLKKLGMALIVALAFSAVIASSAFAAAETKDTTWSVGTAGTVLAGSETISASGSNELVWTIGSTQFRMKSTGLECLECKIENTGGTAVGTGKLKFTGVTFTTPATCKVNGGAITTLAVRFTPDWMIGATDYVKFEPNSGTTFATVKVESGTGSCSISGSYPLSGKLFTRATNATGVYAASQTVASSGAINSAAGGELKFMSGAAELNGTASLALSGSRKGEVFGTKEAAGTPPTEEPPVEEPPAGKAETKDATWRVGSAGTVLTGSETISSTGSGELKLTVGSTPLVFKYMGLECLECDIENSGGAAVGGGKLSFTGVTVVTPSTCAVSGGKITTLAMNLKADYMGAAGSGATWLFAPRSGTAIATISLVSGSGACTISGNYIVSGNFFTKATNTTGVYAASQTVSSSGAINAEGGGSLKFGSSQFEINGTATFALAGARRGGVFGTHE